MESVKRQKETLQFLTENISFGNFLSFSITRSFLCLLLSSALISSHSHAVFSPKMIDYWVI
jgi:hypothetical protein